MDRFWRKASPTYACEIAVIVREGLRRMLEDGENVIYYLTIMNEFYKMPSMPSGIIDPHENQPPVFIA